MNDRFPPRRSCPESILYDWMVTRDRAAAIFENYAYSLSRTSLLNPGAVSERVGPWLCIDAGIGRSAFNIAVLREAPGDPVLALRLAENWYETRGINIRIDLRASEDAAVLAAAVSRSYRAWWTQPALLLEPLPDAWTNVAGFHATVVRTASDVDAYASLDADEYGDSAPQAPMARTAVQLDGCDLLVGWLGGRPVARSMAVTTDEIVGVHNVYVPPRLRGSGLGTAVTTAAIDAGRSRGAVAACLEASPLGLSVYERLGFVPIAEYVTLGREPAP